MNDRPAPPKTLDEQIQTAIFTIQNATKRIERAKADFELCEKEIAKAREQYLQLTEQRRKEQDAAALDKQS